MGRGARLHTRRQDHTRIPTRRIRPPRSVEVLLTPLDQPRRAVRQLSPGRCGVLRRGGEEPDGDVAGSVGFGEREDEVVGDVGGEGGVKVSWGGGVGELGEGGLAVGGGGAAGVTREEAGGGVGYGESAGADGGGGVFGERERVRGKGVEEEEQRGGGQEMEVCHGVFPMMRFDVNFSDRIVHRYQSKGPGA